MRVSFNWIREVVDLPETITPEQLGEQLTNAGIPVEVFEPLTPGIQGIVVAHVLDVVKHPDADKLRVCTVDAGDGEHLQIVCGAANVAAGVKVPCAKIGAKVLDRHSGEKFTIKKSKLRGVESHGMLCSADELGLDLKLLPKGAGEGLLLLPDDAPVGQDVVAYMGLDDVSMELELTPNRSDCLSIRGVAHEISAVLQVPNRFYAVSQSKEADPQLQQTDLQVQIESDACQIYYAQVIEGVRVGPSPIWLQMRLAAQGIRSINNVVDVTNLVMLEWGQPLHAFDYTQVLGKQIRVRYARPGEQLVTLDGQTRMLTDEMQVIADQERAIGIAGVMGGENSEVRESTTTIVLEAAFFDPRVTRRTGKLLGLSSEAQRRFEKGVDPSAVHQALQRASSLIQALAGASINTSPAYVQLEEAKSLTLTLNVDRMNLMLGSQITSADAVSIFKRLDLMDIQEVADGVRVTVPLRRPDLQIEEDLVEEVARLFGYDEIPVTLPQGGITQGKLTPEQLLRRKLRHSAAALGLQEVWTYTLTHPKWLDDMGVDAGSTLRNQVALLSPLSDERQVLRTTLLPSLIEVLQYNTRRKQPDGAIFEIGKTYHPAADDPSRLPSEPLTLAIALQGKQPVKGPLDPVQPVDFFTIKGIVETLLERLGIQQVQYVVANLPWMHPGRSAVLIDEGEQIGYLGAIHPEVAEKWDLQNSYYAELQVDSLIRMARLDLKVQPIPRFPASDRDLAVLLPVQTPVGDVMNSIRSVGGELLETVSLFDIYQGEQVPAGSKSVALALVYRHPQRTLTDEEVAAAHEKIVSHLVDRYGAELRQ